MQLYEKLWWELRNNTLTAPFTFVPMHCVHSKKGVRTLMCHLIDGKLATFSQNDNYALEIYSVWFEFNTFGNLWSYVKAQRSVSETVVAFWSWNWETGDPGPLTEQLLSGDSAPHPCTQLVMIPTLPSPPHCLPAPLPGA